jgi:hypothetical protein
MGISGYAPVARGVKNGFRGRYAVRSGMNLISLPKEADL